MRQIRGIIIHATATPPDWRFHDTTAERVAEVKRWHLDKGWSDVGYHYLIDRDGTIVTGRHMTRDGAHVRGQNKGTIGIALFGGKGSKPTDQFSDHFTPEQDRAVRGLIKDIRKQFPGVWVKGHNDFTDRKACPGFQVSEWLTQPQSAPSGGTDYTKGIAALIAALAGSVALLWEELVKLVGG